MTKQAWSNGSETSKEAAEAALERIPTQKEKVLNFIKQNPKSSRQNISDGTGITLQAVCGRVATLIEEFMIEENSTKMGDYGTHVKTLSVIAKKDLFE